MKSSQVENHVCVNIMIPTTEQIHRAAAEHAFRRARRRAVAEIVWARVRGKSPWLFSYHDVYRRLHARTTQTAGMHDIPLDAIVGSVGRYSDFTRSLLPARDSDRRRWMRLYGLMTDANDAGVPPISVYRVGDAYFVIDGNHRVSVARVLGMSLIRASVTDVTTRVSLTPADDRETLIIKGAYTDFLQKTELDQQRSEVDLLMTSPAKYRTLLDHIGDIRRRSARIHPDRQMSLAEASGVWYDSEYLPVIRKIHKMPALHSLSGRTDADIYVSLLEGARAIRTQCGYNISAESLLDSLGECDAASLARRTAGWLRALTAILNPTKRDRGTRAWC